MTPQATLHDVGTRLAALLPTLDSPNIVGFDQAIGYAIWSIDSLDQSEANVMLTSDIKRTLRVLRKNIVTALVMPLHPDEKAKWARMLDDVSGKAYTRSRALLRETSNTTGQRKIKRTNSDAMRQAKGWQGKLEVFNKIMDDPTPDKVDTSTDVEMAERILQGNTQWWDSEWGKICDTGKFEGLRLLPPEASYGIVSYPVVLVGCKITPILKRQLDGIGMNMSTAFYQYTILHNCKMLGIKSSILPGNAAFVQQVADGILDRIRKEDPSLREYAITKAYRKARDDHSYFIILPSRLNFSFRDWDFANPNMLNDHKPPTKASF